MRQLALLATLAVSGAALLSAPAAAADITVKMLTQGKAGMMVFEPAFVKAKVGDTVHFVPTNPSHNAELIKEIVPNGVAPQSGGMNKEFTLKLTAPGLYGVKCKPHYSMGMVALVQAGAKPANLAAARAAVLPGLAAKRMAPMLAMVR
jgi:pseudoazurin